MTLYRAPHGCSAEDSLWSSGRRYPQRIGVRHPGAHHYPCRICWAFHLLPRWPPRARAHPSSVPLLLPATSPLEAPPSFACQLTSGRPCNPSLSSIISFISSGRETKTSRPRSSSDEMRPEYDSSVHCPLTMLRSMVRGQWTLESYSGRIPSEELLGRLVFVSRPEEIKEIMELSEGLHGRPEVS